MRILDKTILSHLLVAVPPAVALGWMVLDINESALRYESQLLHLSLASQMRSAITSEVSITTSLLGHAERILALEELSIDARRDALRALVAERTLPELWIFTADGRFDTAIRPSEERDRARAALEPSIRTQAVAQGSAVSGQLPDAPEVLVVVPWIRARETFGFLATPIPLSRFGAIAGNLSEVYLGHAGGIEVVDGEGRVLASTLGRTGTDREKTVFASLQLGAGAGGLSELEAGVSTSFVDPTGEPQLASLISAPTLGWIVGTWRPRKVAFESLTRVRTRVLLMSLAAALAAGLVGLLLARTISQPISALISAVQRSAKGGFASGTRVSATGELGRLAGAFNAALDELSRFRGDLHRTTQLRLRLARLVSPAAAHDLLASSGPQVEPAGERPVVLVYADVVLPTEVGQHESEYLVTLLGEFFSAAHETMAKHGGHVDRHSGDAVIGIFLVEGDDPAAAARAAVAAARDLIADAASIGARWEAMLGRAISASAAVASGTVRLTRTAVSGELSAAGALLEQAAAAEERSEEGRISIDTMTRAASGEMAAAAAGVDGWFVL